VKDEPAGKGSAAPRKIGIGQWPARSSRIGIPYARGRFEKTWPRLATKLRSIRHARRRPGCTDARVFGRLPMIWSSPALHRPFKRVEGYRWSRHCGSTDFFRTTGRAKTKLLAIKLDIPQIRSRGLPCMEKSQRIVGSTESFPRPIPVRVDSSEPVHVVLYRPGV